MCYCYLLDDRIEVLTFTYLPVVSENVENQLPNFHSTNTYFSHNHPISFAILTKQVANDLRAPGEDYIMS